MVQDTQRDDPEAGKDSVVRIAPATPHPAQPETRHDEMFCQSCGQVIKKEAAICIHCGVPTKAGRSGVGGAPVYKAGAAGRGEGKSKVASVLLAIFLGVFTWLYTYREDSTKFWLGAGISAAMFILSVLTLGIFLFVAFPVGFGIWIWTIVDTATKKDEWYENY